MVIEEYIPQQRTEIRVSATNPAVIVLSARDEGRLKEQAKQLLSFIKAGQPGDGELADLAYTLQVGRDGMEERLGLIVSSVRELEEKLATFVAGQDGSFELYRGQSGGIKNDGGTGYGLEMARFGAGISRGKYSKLLGLWVKGLSFDWDRLYGKDKPRRMSLPAYPLARDGYWVPEGEAKLGEAGGPLGTIIHPLVHENTSDLMEQRFRTALTGRENFLVDHGIKGRKILPEAAYLEMVRAAVTRASGIGKKGRPGSD